MKASFPLAIAALAALIAFAGQALGQPPHGRPHGPGAGHEGRPMGRMEGMDLDPATRAEIDAIVAETRAAGEQLREELESAELGMRELLSQDAPALDLVMAQAELIGELETERRKHRLATMLAIRALFSDEERAALQQQRMERRDARFEQVRELCLADLEALCPDAEDGQDVRRCLHELATPRSSSAQRTLPGTCRRNSVTLCSEARIRHCGTRPRSAVALKMARVRI